MILITGAARSGTSLTAAVLRACGASLGRTNELNENTAIRDGVLKPLLRSLGADPLGQNPLPPSGREVPQEAVSRLRRGVLVQLQERHPAYKDAKLCLVWEIWASVFSRATWVIVRRREEDIAASCERAPFMRAYGSAEEWLPWVRHYHARLDEVAASVDHVEVWPQEAVTGQIDAFRPAVERCGLEWNADAVSAQIDRRRWHDA